jgi:hypothetical protein
MIENTEVVAQDGRSIEIGNACHTYFWQIDISENRYA